VQGLGGDETEGQVEVREAPAQDWVSTTTEVQ
jgi:hypothetical protein